MSHEGRLKYEMQKTKIKVLNFLSLNEKINFITISQERRFAGRLSLSSQGENIFPRQNECLAIKMMACCNVEAVFGTRCQ